MKSITNIVIKKSRNHFSQCLTITLILTLEKTCYKTNLICTFTSLVRTQHVPIHYDVGYLRQIVPCPFTMMWVISGTLFLWFQQEVYLLSWLPMHTMLSLTNNSQPWQGKASHTVRPWGFLFRVWDQEDIQAGAVSGYDLPSKDCPKWYSCSSYATYSIHSLQNSPSWGRALEGNMILWAVPTLHLPAPRAIFTIYRFKAYWSSKWIQLRGAYIIPEFSWDLN